MPTISKVVNKDLKDERDKVKFNVDEFSNWFYGSAEKVEEKRKIGTKHKERETLIDDRINAVKLLFFSIRKLLLIR